MVLLCCLYNFRNYIIFEGFELILQPIMQKLINFAQGLS